MFPINNEHSLRINGYQRAYMWIPSPRDQPSGILDWTIGSARWISKFPWRTKLNIFSQEVLDGSCWVSQKYCSAIYCSRAGQGRVGTNESLFSYVYGYILWIGVVLYCTVPLSTFYLGWFIKFESLDWSGAGRIGTHHHERLFSRRVDNPEYIQYAHMYMRCARSGLPKGTLKFVRWEY